MIENKKTLKKNRKYIKNRQQKVGITSKKERHYYRGCDESNSVKRPDEDSCQVLYSFHTLRLTDRSMWSKIQRKNTRYNSGVIFVVKKTFML